MYCLTRKAISIDFLVLSDLLAFYSPKSALVGVPAVVVRDVPVTSLLLLASVVLLSPSILFLMLLLLLASVALLSYSLLFLVSLLLLACVYCVWRLCCC
jgi:hypothetical protein